VAIEAFPPLFSLCGIEDMNNMDQFPHSSVELVRHNIVVESPESTLLVTAVWEAPVYGEKALR